MNTKTLIAISASIFISSFCSSVIAQPLPANIHAGKSVLRNINHNASVPEILQYCKINNIPSSAVGPLKGKNEFCVMAFSANLTSKGIVKSGYSTQDTVAQIGKDMGLSYQHAGLGDLLLPLSGLASFKEGQDFLIKNGMMRSSDRANFDKINELEKNTKAARNKKADPECVKRKMAEFSFAGPMAKKLAETAPECRK